MSHTPIGGRKRRAWRLKKKHDKWFSEVLQRVISATIEELPKGNWLNFF